MHEIVDRISKAHGHDDSTVAIAFAQKLFPKILALANAMSRLQRERALDGPIAAARYEPNKALQLTSLSVGLRPPSGARS